LLRKARRRGTAKFTESELKRAERKQLDDQNAKKRDAAIEQTLTGLAACRELGILDQMEYLDFEKTIAGHSPEVFVRFIKNYLKVPPNFL